MTDMEDYIITQVKNELVPTVIPIKNIGSDYSITPESFPYVHISATAITPDMSARIVGHPNFQETMMLTVEVYSNRSSGRKSEAKGIMRKITAKLSTLNFIHTYESQEPYEPGYFRLVSRYTAKIRHYKRPDPSGQSDEMQDVYVIYQN